MERFQRPIYLTGVVGEPSQMIYMPYVDRVTIMGPLPGTSASVSGQTEVDTPSRRAILVCRPAKPAEETKCAQRILTTLARRAFRRPVTDADMQPLVGSTTRAATRPTSKRASKQRCAAFSSAPSSCSASNAIRPASHRHGLSHQRSRAGLAAVVLPLEQHSRRRAAGRLPSRGKLEDAARARAAGAPDAGGSPLAALVDNFAGQWL